MDEEVVTRRPDLTGLQATYPQVASRGQQWLWPVLFAVAVMNVVIQSILGNWGGAVTWGCGALLYSIVILLVVKRPPATMLDADGVQVRLPHGSIRTVPWADVEDIHVQTKWEDYSTLRPRDGKTLRLHGLPREAAWQVAHTLHGKRGLRGHDDDEASSGGV